MPAHDMAPTAAMPIGSENTTQVAVPMTLAHLVGIRGPAEFLGARFALAQHETTIGRLADCDITVNQGSVSRVHAIVRFDGAQWYVVHRSRTNPTLVNGDAVEEMSPIYDGDELLIADAVGFRLDAPGAHRRASPRSGSLRAAMEQRLELDDRIEREFVRIATFLDVDVVDSYGLKSSGERPEYIVVSFERFRELVDECVVASRGRILNSNGDEVMAFFDTADDAIDAAERLVRALAEFNRSRNRLSRPFRIRMGAHTGQSAVDLKRGVAYSPVLDLAGHLQKAAPVDGLLISETTREALSRDHAMERTVDTGKAAVSGFALRFS